MFTRKGITVNCQNHTLPFGGVNRITKSRICFLKTMKVKENERDSTQR